MFHAIAVGFGLMIGMWLFANLGTVILGAFALLGLVWPAIKATFKFLYLCLVGIYLLGILAQCNARGYSWQTLQDYANANGSVELWVIIWAVLLWVGWKLFRRKPTRQAEPKINVLNDQQPFVVQELERMKKGLLDPYYESEQFKKLL